MKAKTRKWATVSVLIELIASLILPLCFYFFKDFIGLDNIEQQLIVVLVYIGFFYSHIYLYFDKSYNL